MITPKDMGKRAQKKGINAPTIDNQLSAWLGHHQGESRTLGMISWWDGWYEGLDESLASKKATIEA